MNPHDDAFVIGLLIVALIWMALPLLAIGGLEWWHRRSNGTRERPVLAMAVIAVIWAVVSLFAFLTLFGFAI